MNVAEREIIDAKTSLEMEQQQRKRLEAKLRQTISTGEHAANVRGDFSANSPAPSNQGGGVYEGSSSGCLSIRNQLLAVLTGRVRPSDREAAGVALRCWLALL